MNILRGLFRLWLIFAVLFAIVTVAVSYTDVRNEFFWSAPPKELDFRTLFPVDCSQARGTFEANYSRSDGLCWYEEPTFRSLYPEYRDLSEQELSKRLYAKVGRPLKEMRPWRLVAERAGIALGVPLAVLAFGWSLVWALSGFSRDSAPPPAAPQ
jgi:hypothetical protein